LFDTIVFEALGRGVVAATTNAIAASGRLVRRMKAPSADGAGVWPGVWGNHSMGEGPCKDSSLISGVPYSYVADRGASGTGTALATATQEGELGVIADASFGLGDARIRRSRGFL